MRRYIIVIGTSFAFCSINCFIARTRILSLSSNSGSTLLALGLIMAIMVPISVVDPREQMRSKRTARFYIAMHLLFGTVITVLFSCYWLILPIIVETTILLALFYSHR